MIEIVERTIRAHAMVVPGEPLWVAVSGGMDSMVLWHVLRTLGHPCALVHVDHGLRGAESNADREFVLEQGHAMGGEVHVQKVDVPAAMAANGGSVQMAARALRYAVFHDRVRLGPGKLAMAHHQDDAVETFLIHLLRGMGSHGWAGIPPRTGAFVRPLIACRRAEIEAYAREHAIPFRQDASNTDPHYLRNRVRHELLPLMEELRPGATQVLVRNVLLAREMEAMAGEALHPLVAAFMPGADGASRLPLDRILGSGAPHLVLHALLGPKGFHPDALDQLLQAMERGRTGAVFKQGEWRVTVDRHELVLETVTEDGREWTIPAPDAVPPDAPLRISLAQAPEGSMDAGPAVALLDPARVSFPLCLRPWRPGDRMRPAGLHGSKLISDLLTDAKVPAHAKKQAWVLESEGRIIWLCGLRLAEGVKAISEQGPVLRVEMGVG